MGLSEQRDRAGSSGSRWTSAARKMTARADTQFIYRCACCRERLCMVGLTAPQSAGKKAQ